MTTFFLTCEPPRHNNNGAGGDNNGAGGHTEGKSEAKKRSPLVSDDEASGSGSVSSWPFSRPPSLSHFDDVDERFARTMAFADQDPRSDDLSFGIGSSYFEVERSLLSTPQNSSMRQSQEDLLGALNYDQQQPQQHEEPRPQLSLVMPRVDLPSRKPFTPGGLRLGKLKVLVAGAPKSGKTELIRAMLDTSEDIVFADEPRVIDSEIVETTASTKPYPLHWLERHERRKSSHINCSSSNVNLIESLESVTSSDGVLDRNICFVDTHGPGSQAPDKAVQYLESQFRQTANVLNALEPQIISLFTSASSLSDLGHVDVCLYVISGQLSEDDAEYIAEIGEFAPVVPVLGKVDMLTRHELLLAKVNTLRQLKEAGLDPFLFDAHIDEAIEQGQRIVSDYEQQMNATMSPQRHVVHSFFMPCGVSTKRSSSDLSDSNESYELVHSELCHLLRYMISEHGSAWLRYVTAQKFVAWHHQIRTSQLIPYGYRGNMSVTTYQHRNPMQFNHVDVSPEFLRPGDLALPVATRAQSSMVKWAVAVEQMSRDENAAAVAVRNRSRSMRPHRTSRPLRRVNSHKGLRASRSIHGVDPLNLSGWWRWSVRHIVRALSVLVGIRLTYHVYCRLVGTVDEGLICNISRTKGLQKVLSSLGGGWAVIV